MAIIFLDTQDIREIQEQLIDEFGGIHGIRDDDALESALVAVHNRVYYEQVDIIACSATYAYHLTQAHAFLDGNKRIGAAAAEIFLDINGVSLRATNDQIVDLFLNIAAGVFSREDIEKIFRAWVA